MSSPDTPSPSPEELQLQELQLAEAKKRQSQLDVEEARQKRDKQSMLASMAAGRSGVRSLLSGDWSGYTRGADLGPRA
jgi:hypothetical protein